MAGVSRLQYATDIRLIRVMCSGRVDLAFVLRAFLNGMDGVFIGGCRLNECNYITHGNYDALNMVLLCRRLLEHIGLNPDRLKIEFMSSGEGHLFTEIINAFSGHVKALGPIGQAEGIGKEEMTSRLKDVMRLVPYIKIEKQDKLASRLYRREDYDGLFTSEEIHRMLCDVVSYHINPGKCQACLICLRKCPVEAISGAKNQIHVIDQDKCIRCGACYAACPERFGAVDKISGAPVPPPIPVEQRAIDRKSPNH